jgi:uncharacterized protein (TIGR02466 family)
LNIDYVFPHPIARIDISDEVDNELLLSSVRELSEGIDETHASKFWDCKLLTSFQNEKVNHELARRNSAFIEVIEKYANEFMTHVGWYQPNKKNHITQMWFNRYVEGYHFQEAHNHGVHEVCAIYYATDDLTPTLFLNPNTWTFHNHYDVTDATPVTTKDYRSFAQKGTLVLFPGYLLHSVPYIRKNESNFELSKDRVTIAMNFGKYEKSLLTKAKL